MQPSAAARAAFCAVVFAASLGVGMVPVAAAPAASISGTVARAGGGGPLAGVCVDATVASGGGYSPVGQTATTAGDGTYSLDPLPVGRVRVRFYDCPNGGPDIEMWNGGSPDMGGAPPIDLAPGDHLTGVDAQLETGVVVSGTVTDGQGNPLAGINVNVNSRGYGVGSGSQTDGSGRYTTNALPSGDYLVTFSDSITPHVWAAQTWNGHASSGDADSLGLSTADGPTRTGIDAVMALGASASGTVTRTGGAPVADICVNATPSTSRNSDSVSSATTASDGTYTLTGLPATALEIDFSDCDNSDTHVEQWWNGASRRADAEPVNVASGGHRSGIDAVLALSGRFTGTVTDGAAHGLEGICVQAIGSGFVGASTETDANGGYALGVPQGGAYRIQFVDCTGNAALAGQWFPGRAGQDTAQPVAVLSGQTVAGIDAVMVPGAPGTISGRVTNRHGVAMDRVCVVAYLPFKFAVPALVGSDGTYVINDVPSGTYALGYLSCDGDRDASPIVADPEAAGLDYAGVWWPNATLSIDDHGDSRLDPLRQGATLVAVHPGEHLTGYDRCFGCVTITISSITPGVNSLTIAFDVTQPVLAAGATSVSSASSVSSSGVSAAAAPSAPLTYTASCWSADGGTSGSASGSGSPITVTGLTAGAGYACAVVASDQISAVGMSTSSPTVVVPHSLAPASPDGSARPPAAAPIELAATGAPSPGPVVIGLADLAIGTSLISASRRRARSRSTSAGRASR